MKPATLAILITTACLSAPAWAGTPINQTRPLAVQGRLDVSNVKGRVEVRAWDRAEVRIGGELGAGARPLAIEGNGNALRIDVQYPNATPRSQPTTLLLQVPRQIALEVQTVAADIDIEGLARGGIVAESVSGGVRVVAAPAKARLSAVSGDVAATLNSADVEIESVSGDVRLSGRLTGRVQVENVSGQVFVETLGQRLDRLALQTVSGDVVAVAALRPGGEARLESLSGDALLRLPPDLSARVEGESFSGTLSAPRASVKKEPYGPGATLRGSYGTGNGRVRLETFSGNATLRLDAPAGKD